ncbi:MAG: hypothetical protein ABR583_05465 [Gaiellaceae bacterium]
MLVFATTVAVAAAFAAQPQSASAMVRFSDNSLMGLDIRCDGQGGLSQGVFFYAQYNGAYEAAPVAWYRTWIFNHQTNRWFSSDWFSMVPSMTMQGPSLWAGGLGTYSFYAEYARSIGGRWQFGGESRGFCRFPGAFGAKAQRYEKGSTRRPPQPPIRKRAPR